MGMRFGRVTRFSLRLAVVLLVLGQVLVAATPGLARPALGKAPLDLPALALRPSDLDELGLEDYRASNGGWLTPLQTALVVGIDYGLGDDEAIDRFVDRAGVRGSYDLLISHLWDQDEAPKSTRGVWITLYEFGDAAGAAVAYDFFSSHPFASLAPDVEPLDVPAVGDDAFGATWEAKDPKSKDPMTEMGVGFRSGRVYVEITFWDILRPGEEADPPTEREFARIVRSAADRVERGLAGDLEEGAGLSSRVPRFDSLDIPVISRADRYLGIAGEPVHGFEEAPAEVAERAEAMADGGVIAGYLVVHEIMLTEQPDADDPQLRLQVERYADEDAAADGWQAAYDRNADCACTEDELAPGDLATLGDEAAAFEVTLSWDGASSRGYLILIRTGTYVSEVWLTSRPGETIARATALAALQADCATNGCNAALALPDALVD